MSVVASPDREELGKRELVGDALVLLFAREHLRSEYPDIPRSHYQAMCALLVSNETLNAIAADMDLTPLGGGRSGPASAFEVLVADVYAEKGMGAARRLFIRAIEGRFDIRATAATWHPRDGVTPVHAPAPPARTCEICGERYTRGRAETRRRFEARRFCSRTCAGRRPRPKKQKQRPRELVKCAACRELFEVIPSRIERSRSGFLYCSRDCQAEHRRRGGPLHHQEDGPLRVAVAADARTGRYSLRELAERHGSPEGTIGAILHREGIRLTEARNRRDETD